MASTAELRKWWKKYECKPSLMEKISFFDDKIKVPEETVPAWQALEQVMRAHGYKVRNKDTASYNCRNISGTNKKSLHSYGIALDVNWSTNPWKDHPGTREVIFSSKDTQAERAVDVKAGRADTDMTAGMIADILAIQTKDKKTVFEWGGTWNGVKDAMHFEIDLSPSQLAKGIDPASLPYMAPPSPVNGQSSARLHYVNARDGLGLYNGPGAEFDVLEMLPYGTPLFEIDWVGQWKMVSREDDPVVDGFVLGALLSPGMPPKPDEAGAEPETETEPQEEQQEVGSSDLEHVTWKDVAPVFHLSARQNVKTHWPQVKSGLKEYDLFDPEMLAMALATIKAETASFRPISEGISKYNTLHSPFDLYDAGTAKGKELGNTKKGDGPRYKGRGFVQLTGRYNYTHQGLRIGEPLPSDPGLANDPVVAGRLLAAFLKSHEASIRAALILNSEAGLKQARRLVNGGSHGFTRFKEAYQASRAAFG